MQAGVIAVVLLASLFTAGAAPACEGLAGIAGEPLVLVRKPVHGDDVRFTSGFGLRLHPLLQQRRLHTGIDWAAPVGTPVVAAAAGQVVLAEPTGEYGNAVRIDHGGGWQTLYSQLSRIDVREGDCVATGAVIAAVGSTGLSSGPHLHFEVRRDGRPIDPLSVGVNNEPPEPEDNK